MTYQPSPRDFDLTPRNRYASMRMGLSQPRNRATEASTLHRLSARLVMVAVVSVIALSVAVLVPPAFEALGNIAATYEGLGPTPR